ncbi:uncharacterized protein LOC133323619, partial [Musca vetustissima]|uniref:uncharacterized protein LOC133323619 n=1 Tax=Musca vetustissima TaxID=27455 RepID=UPI002AB62D37
MTNANDQVMFLQEKCYLILDECVPLKTFSPKNEEKPWFNNHIKDIIYKRDYSYKRWKKYKTPELYEQFKSLRREVTRCIQKAKSTYYKCKFSTALSSKCKWKKIREIGIGNKYRSHSNNDIDVEELNLKFVGPNLAVNSENFYSRLNIVHNENEFSFRCVEHTEVISTFKEIKSNAEGMDGINPKLLRLILPKILPYIIYILNTILVKSTFPGAWKQAKIIPIPKANHEYRPIAILPLISKVLETLMYKQINEYLTKNNMLTEHQSGFRKNRSCVTALLDVTEDLRCNQDNMQDSFLVLLDHSKAFDT